MYGFLEVDGTRIEKAEVGSVVSEGDIIGVAGNISPPHLDLQVMLYAEGFRPSGNPDAIVINPIFMYSADLVDRHRMQEYPDTPYGGRIFDEWTLQGQRFDPGNFWTSPNSNGFIYDLNQFLIDTNRYPANQIYRGNTVLINGD